MGVFTQSKDELDGEHFFSSLPQLNIKSTLKFLRIHLKAMLFALINLTDTLRFDLKLMMISHNNK